ncbi:hypothetical protein BZA70DRAFT_268272 [Myxozyma melibiosi]|uniref:Telomere replication protein EST3 n=1 Tax=Myxozyma melibiosi TaxID=54550 RepID=A0ABR1F3L2_9ASCO
MDTLPSSQSDIGEFTVASLITTVPLLVTLYTNRRGQSLAESQDPLAVRHRNDGLRRFRVLGQVADYDPANAILMLEDYDDLRLMDSAEEEKYSAVDLLHADDKRVQQRYRIIVSLENVVLDSRFDHACTQKGTWINVIGRLGLSADDEGSEARECDDCSTVCFCARDLELVASFIWACDTVLIDETRDIFRKLIRQREVVKRSPYC